MDRQAIAEDVVGLWGMVEDAWAKTHESAPKIEVLISLFERAHTFIIHKNISEERAGRTHQPEERAGKEHCNKCGRILTEKEVKYLEDTKADPWICYHCKKGL